jgi:preprotein translocase subunit YajC
LRCGVRPSNIRRDFAIPEDLADHGHFHAPVLGPVRPMPFRPIVMPLFVVAQGGGDDIASLLVGWAPIIAVVVVGYLLLFLPQQKERKRRLEMLSSLKKNDRVVTTSGMIGTVANVSQDGKEITLKFGEATRIPFLRSAIDTVLRDSAEAEAADKTAAKT